MAHEHEPYAEGPFMRLSGVSFPAGSCGTPIAQMTLLSGDFNGPGAYPPICGFSGLYENWIIEDLSNPDIPPEVTAFSIDDDCYELGSPCWGWAQYAGWRQAMFAVNADILVNLAYEFISGTSGPERLQFISVFYKNVTYNVGDNFSVY